MDSMLDSMCLSANVPVQWISEVMHFCPGLPIILVACKKDLRRDPRVIDELRRTNQRPVTPEEVSDKSARAGIRSLPGCVQGMAVAQRIGAKQYLECSARTGEGVAEVFQNATRAALLTRGKTTKRKGCEIL
jgi:Ras homolog gene family, member A